MRLAVPGRQAYLDAWRRPPAQDRGERVQVLRVETVGDEDGRGFTGSQRDDRVDDCVEVDECRAFREGGRGQRTRHKYEHGAHRAGPPA